jgi:hypothetical protein
VLRAEGLNRYYGRRGTAPPYLRLLPPTAAARHADARTRFVKELAVFVRDLEKREEEKSQPSQTEDGAPLAIGRE